MAEKNSLNSRLRVFLFGSAILGIALVVLATSRYGAGVSSDAARNLSTAESLLLGRGFVDMVGAPFVLWPPLYPLLLAGLSFVTTFDVFQVAWYLNVLVFGANILLVGLFLLSIFRDKPWFVVTGTLMFLLSRSMLRIHANVASEPLFASFMLICFLAGARFLETGSRLSLWAMCLAAGLAALQRYLGVALVFVSATVIWRRGGWRELLKGSLPLIFACAPLSAWVLLHNLPLSGAPFGPREMGAMLPIQNMGLALSKMLWWFIPRWGPLDWLILRPLLLIAAAGAVLGLVSRRRDWAAWTSALSQNAIWPALLFGLVYFLLLAFTVVTADHLDLTSDRYYAILLPVIIALVLATLDFLLLTPFARANRRAVPLVAGLLLLWFVYPLYSVQSYLRTAVQQGEPTNYNIANSAHFREMSVVKAAEPVLKRDADAVVYSNYLNIVWFIFRHPVRVLPFHDESLSHAAQLADLSRAYSDWPPQDGYVIWFTPNEYHHIVPPADLATIADLELLFEDETGQVFFVRRRAH